MNLYNNKTGFMEARNSDGSWAGEEAGWTEGDHWAYSLDVMVCLSFSLRNELIVARRPGSDCNYGRKHLLR